MLVVSDVQRAAGHRQVGVGRLQIGAQLAPGELGSKGLERLQVGAYAPKHHLGVGPHPHEAVRLDGEPGLELRQHTGKLPFPNLALLLG